MLSRPNRLTRGADYKLVVRRGRRCASPHTVTYLASSGEDRAVRFGFIINKQVGSAVMRNTVRRRLKAVCHQEMSGIRPGTDVVIRALPSAASVDFHVLRDEVSRCLARRAA